MQMGMLKKALASRLGLPFDGVSLCYEGRDLDDDRTLRENGISEPGPAARRSGVKVGLTFMRHDGFELSMARRIREEQEVSNEEARLEQERRAKAEQEKAAMEKRLEEEKAERERKAAEAAQRQAAGGAPAEEVPRMTLRVSPLGSSEGEEIQVPVAASVGELAQQVSREMGQRRDENHQGGLLLLYQGEVMQRNARLRDYGLRDGSEVSFFWGEGGVAEAA
eukprot:TRINITY_DN15191_c0_g1_i2.p1 TRINITY_DN15191_c0_g1~~TRINITY_DN15191_c0_g1_i2.p1  ORF type:complete len:222 (+),score=72.24 TRINITY_DN15191_c0_g1_i2:364-1029(+)